MCAKPASVFQCMDVQQRQGIATLWQGKELEGI